ncbi:MAG: hypothetical protein K0R67_3971, partial [Paenibacillus sp.]|nr:hypothetical protein [Paenibacillus sp.]
DDYPKVQGYPVEQAVWNDLNPAPAVSQSDSFHKLVFRQGFEIEDAYLGLDGFSAGTHGHEDGNAIVRYSANGRIFIDARDYIERNPIHQTGITIVKDGELTTKPPLVRLNWGADVDGVMMSSSVVPNYNAADWERQIISPDGNFFIVYDQVKMNEAGSFMLENTWQTLGTPSLVNKRFETEQQDVVMTIESLDESDLRTYDRYGHFKKYYKSTYPYEYADQETVLRQVMEEETYAAGEKRSFINLLSSSTSGTPVVAGTRLSDSAISVMEGTKEWLAVWGGLGTDVWSSDGKMHLISDEQWVAAEASHIRIGSTVLSFTTPVLFTLNLITDAWEAYELKTAITQYDNNGDPIAPALVDSGTIDVSPAQLAELQTDIRNGVYHANWSKIGSFGSEVTASAVGDLGSDNIDEILVAGKNGTVKAYNQSGTLLWTFSGNSSRVNEVTIHRSGGTAYVFVATEDFKVFRLNPSNGTSMWSYTFPSDALHAETKGNLVGITNVRLANLNVPPGAPLSVMVGTQFRYLYTLSLSGTLENELMTLHYGIQDMEFFDMDNDGKDEGILAMEYTSINAYHDGVTIRTLGTIGAQGPGWTAVTKVPATPRPRIALGTKNNQVHLIEYNGTVTNPPLWSRNVGGEVTDIQAGDYDTDGQVEIIAASEGHQVYVFNANGTTRWRANLGDRVLAVRALYSSSTGEVMAAADHGHLFELSWTGAVNQANTFKDRIKSLLSLNQNTGTAVVLEDGQIYKRN